MKKVRYTGQAGRRIVDKYVWAGQGDVQRVRDDLVERLLSNGDFELIEDGESEIVPADAETEQESE